MKNRFLIGEVSEYLGVSRDTLRYYDKDNILKPSIIEKWLSLLYNRRYY